MSDKKPTISDIVKSAGGSAIMFGTSLENYPKKVQMAMLEDPEEILEKAGYDKKNPLSPLMYAIDQATGNNNGSAKKKAPALAFDVHPAPSDNYLGLVKSKRRLLPDELIKQIRVTDHLVASIVRARSNMMSMYGHLRKDRFDIGIEVCIKPEFYKILNNEQLLRVEDRMKKFEKILLNCGHIEGLENQDKMTLSEWLAIQTGNGISFGRFASEIIYDRSGKPDKNGKYPFHRFRPVDVGTILRAVRKGENVGNNLRVAAVAALESLEGEKFSIDLDKLKEDRYAWIQMIDGQPRQAFTHDELLVFNMFPSTDVEMNGYPVSPLDTIINSVTTHISIDAYIKLYFQNGRASKGMLVIQSDEVDESVLNTLKIQFNAAINSVSNSFRTPIFGVGKEDKVAWIDTNDKAGDGDFAYTYDQVARNILSAFGMSPDELPGYSHLSRGTNSQTLSESNNEYKLTASRDSGLRPLILKIQTFFNQRLFPIIDEELSEICEIKFSGIDAQSKEAESTRLQQDSALHMTYDELARQVDKEPIGDAFGGKVPMNERLQLIVDKYLNIGEFKSKFTGDPSAYIDPMQRYKRDPFFLQMVQLMSQISPSTVMAYFAPRPEQISMEFLKMNIQDMLEEDNEH